jgi:acetyl/propionyl-CoA carboxylase alpha subunit
MRSRLNRLLVANRGEIACRIIDTARALGIQTVAVRHPLDHKARHAEMADVVRVIEGDTAVAAHLDGAQLIDIAREAGCDAVHPGYGFLSENARCASAVVDAGLVFIGPSANTIALMGDKIAAREFAAAHGVPVAPSVMPTSDLQSFAEAAARIGFPLMVKAAAGGGGKGMNVVRLPAELAERAALASSEAARYFGDPRIYAERFIEQPRHIEVQVLGDGTGRVIHLGERECSIQRRFQKVIEEAPCAGLSPATREQVIESAVRLASAARYANAGTVEFVVSPDGTAFFLEMNTRLQVEHRVTELIYGVDLVAMQLAIACGQPLPEQHALRAAGHAIECRICAEDPQRDFLPQTGRVLRVVQPQDSWVIFDSGLQEGQLVGTSFDSMLAKLVVVGANRDEAIRRMVRALHGTAVLGLTTNLEFLARVIAHPAFQAGELHTGFLPLHAKDLGNPAMTPAERTHALLAAAMAHHGWRDPALSAQDHHARLGSWRN